MNIKIKDYYKAKTDLFAYLNNDNAIYMVYKRGLMIHGKHYKYLIGDKFRFGNNYAIITGYDHSELELYGDLYYIVEQCNSMGISISSEFCISERTLSQAQWINKPNKKEEFKTFKEKIRT